MGNLLSSSNPKVEVQKLKEQTIEQLFEMPDHILCDFINKLKYIEQTKGIHEGNRLVDIVKNTNWDKVDYIYLSTQTQPSAPPMLLDLNYSQNMYEPPPPYTPW
jgi:hypothetical protein